jgi:hypothetical protein
MWNGNGNASRKKSFIFAISSGGAFMSISITVSGDNGPDFAESEFGDRRLAATLVDVGLVVPAAGGDELF